MTGQLVAVPFQPHPEKISLILDKCCAHRPWFPDHLWHDPEVRRLAANNRLAAWITTGPIWEAWRGDELIGILGVDEVRPQHDAQCHFIFFDRDLAGKSDLCLEIMAVCFATYGLTILRCEIPTYAKALARFARKRLGFRYEAEARALSWPRDKRATQWEAELGSRRYRAQFYEGQWHDALLLSITREEFYGSQGGAQRRLDSASPQPHPGYDGPAPELPAESHGTHAEPVAGATHQRP